MRTFDLRTAFFAVCCLAAASSNSTQVCALGGEPQKNDTFTYADGREFTQPYHSPSFLSWQSLRIGDGCVLVEGQIATGKFFIDLKKKKTRDGPVFRVGHKVVTDFPDQVRVSIGLLSGVPCSRDVPPGPVIPSLESLRSLRAEAVYIRDLKKYPLEIDLEQEGFDLPPGFEEFSSRIRQFRYELKTKGLLLTDALLITLYSKEGKKVAQLSWRQ